MTDRRRHRRANARSFEEESRSDTEIGTPISLPPPVIVGGSANRSISTGNRIAPRERAIPRSLERTSPWPARSLLASALERHDLAGWRPHPANESSDSARIDGDSARENVHRANLSDAEDDDDAEKSERESLSFSHSHVVRQSDAADDDYDGIFQFVNTAHELGWSVASNAAEKEDRSLSLKPPSAAVAENNAIVMQRICHRFEKTRFKPSE